MSNFPGRNQGMPGAFRMVWTQTSTVMPVGWFEIDFRTDDPPFDEVLWFGGCDLLTADQRVAASARGELKRVNIFMTAGTAKVADHDGGYVSNGQFYPLDSGGLFPSVSMDYTNQMGRHSIWVNTSGTTVSWTVEVFFDIPPEEDV